MIADPAEIIIESLTLFAKFEPMDEKAGQIHVDSISNVEPFEDTTGVEIYTCRPDTNSKRTPRKFSNLLDTGEGAMKKAGMISVEEFAGLDGIVVGRSVCPGSCKKRRSWLTEACLGWA